MSIMNNHDFLPDICSTCSVFTHSVRKFSKKNRVGSNFTKNSEKNNFFENLSYPLGVNSNLITDEISYRQNLFLMNLNQNLTEKF